MQTFGWQGGVWGIGKARCGRCKKGSGRARRCLAGQGVGCPGARHRGGGRAGRRGSVPPCQGAAYWYSTATVKLPL